MKTASNFGRFSPKQGQMPLATSRLVQKMAGSPEFSYSVEDKVESFQGLFANKPDVVGTLLNTIHKESLERAEKEGKEENNTMDYENNDNDDNNDINEEIIVLQEDIIHRVEHEVTKKEFLFLFYRNIE